MEHSLFTPLILEWLSRSYYFGFPYKDKCQICRCAVGNPSSIVLKGLTHFKMRILPLYFKRGCGWNFGICPLSVQHFL